MMEERDDLRQQDTVQPRLPTMNDDIAKATSDYKRRQWRDFVETIDHRPDTATSCGGPLKNGRQIQACGRE